MGLNRQVIESALRLQEMAKRNLANFRYRIVVLSGKGGVGKSFVSTMLALALAEMGKRVALFDADIYGSSTPQLLGLQGTRLQADEEGGILPAEGPLGLRVVAINLIVDAPETPVIWRGPLASRAVIELVAKVRWGSGDYLVVDMPPGTGDIAITIAQLMPRETYTIIVTAPNILSEVVVAKAINFAIETKLKLLGVVENMSYFTCPYCGRETSIMGKVSGEHLASKYNTVVLVKIPLDPRINEAIDKGVPYIVADKEGEAAKAIRRLAERVVKIIESMGGEEES
uniref:Iron-sulfur cluster carrier protein n=1 Tax=Ignisphaera aggregans TaxID=334771 RepID=A0A7C4FDF0_9CREN